MFNNDQTVDIKQYTQNDVNNHNIHNIMAVENPLPVRVITPEIVNAARITNGMTVEEIDARIEAVFIAQGE